MPSLLQPGTTCRCIRRARRLRVLVDAAAYFAAVRHAIARAEHSVFIVGWDIDSRLQLVPRNGHEPPPDGLPAPLADFLCAVAERNPHVRIHVLAWDFAMLYALEREWLPSYRLGWRTHARVRFRLDGQHPVGASHHQKIVVVDDRLAFVGGIDLTRSRWDTPAHAPDEPLRHNVHNGRKGREQPYAPFHDIHTMFDGEAAEAIAELVRERWLRAFGKARTQARAAPQGLPQGLPQGSPRTPQRADTHADAWPPFEPTDFEDADIGIALTEPAFSGRAPVEDIRALYLAAIAAARENIYVENQYFTASPVGTSLVARLTQPEGPDVAVVAPRAQTGWLQTMTMGVLRARLYRMVKRADDHGRLRLYYPHVEGLGDDFVNVHSKLMIVDDELLFVGSANLNNRSMVLDTECNIALEARGDPRIRAAIAQVRNRLLAEHLDVSLAEVERAFQTHGRLHAVIDALRHEGRALVPFDPEVEPEIDRLIPDEALIDPEKPASPDELVREFVPGGRGRSLSGRLFILGGLALGVVALALLWHFTSLRHYLNFTALTQTATAVGDTRFGPVLIVGGYALAAIASVPITVLIALAGFVFGPGAGSAYALTGTLIAALVTYGAGVWLGRDAVRRLAGARLNRLSERLGRQGLVAVVILRVLPLAPFTLVNLAAGASHIGLRDFLVGTTLGMGPGIVLAASFAHQLVATVRHPSAASIGLLAAIGVVLVALSFALQRFFARGR